MTQKKCLLPRKIYFICNTKINIQKQENTKGNRNKIKDLLYFCKRMGVSHADLLKEVAIFRKFLLGLLNVNYY